MIGLDTNVLVRYIMQDDAAQSAKVAALMDSFTVCARWLPGYAAVRHLRPSAFVFLPCDNRLKSGMRLVSSFAPHARSCKPSRKPFSHSENHPQ